MWDVVYFFGTLTFQTLLFVCFCCWTNRWTVSHNITCFRLHFSCITNGLSFSQSERWKVWMRSNLSGILMLRYILHKYRKLITYAVYCRRLTFINAPIASVSFSVSAQCTFLTGFGHCARAHHTPPDMAMTTNISPVRYNGQLCNLWCLALSLSLTRSDVASAWNECENAKYAHNQSLSRTLPTMQFTSLHSTRFIAMRLRTSKVNNQELKWMRSCAFTTSKWMHGWEEKI